VVDDEFGMRELFSLVLGSHGYDVATAASCEEALDVVAEEEPRLVYLDMRLPRMDGLSIFRELRERRPGLDVIVMTGYVASEQVQQALAEGARGCLQKPFTVAELLTSLRGALDGKSS
jgi:CheY-like chemotaxis protein